MKKQQKKLLSKVSKIEKKAVASNVAVLAPAKKSNLLKTLIVFDTNMLREMLGKEVAYNKFSFGKAYDELNSFINENGLNNDVVLTVSTMVIEELKNQKKRAYLQDINDLKEIVKRLEGLPHIAENSITIPDANFDCEIFVEENAKKFIDENGINTLVYKDEHSTSILSNMIKKVATVDKPKSPFAISGNYKDAGFKDSIIWETLMHFEKVEEFDKIIFLSKDGDYKENCIDDFKSKWNRHIKIEKDKNNVIAELKTDYELYIKERGIYDFAQTDYFKDYLFDGLKTKTEICFDEANFKIENFEITDTCINIERLPISEDFEENLIIQSSIKIFFADNSVKKEQIVVAKTTLADDETKEILETTFEPELI